jgi:hypothetical protein
VPRRTVSFLARFSAYSENVAKFNPAENGWLPRRVP